MNKFQPGQRIRARSTGDDLGTVVRQSGGVIRSSNEMHYYARDIEAAPEEGAEALSYRPGDLCPSEGAPITGTAVLIGDNLQLVWQSRPTPRGVDPEVRVELRRLDGSYVTTVAIGNVTPGHLMLALPYLDERYGEHEDDWLLSEGTDAQLGEEVGSDGSAD